MPPSNVAYAYLLITRTTTSEGEVASNDPMLNQVSHDDSMPSQCTKEEGHKKRITREKKEGRRL